MRKSEPEYGCYADCDIRGFYGVMQKAIEEAFSWEAIDEDEYQSMIDDLFDTAESGKDQVIHDMGDVIVERLNACDGTPTDAYWHWEDGSLFLSKREDGE